VADIVSNFFNKKRDEVAEVQQDITKTTLDTLFEFSPHLHDPYSKFAKGEYEINHKVSINDSEPSQHHPPASLSGSPAAISQEDLKEYIEKEKDTSNGIECGDAVGIFNTTKHAVAVETGNDPMWVKEGYHTYTLTRDSIKLRYKNVLK